MKIKDVMTENVRFVGPEARLVEIARLMRDEDIGAVPVVESDKLVGMITDRDIIVRALAEGREANGTMAREVMSPQMLYCYDDQKIDEVLENMGEKQIRRLPVVNRDKRLVGVVSLGDLSKAAEKKAGNALKDISQPAH